MNLAELEKIKPYSKDNKDKIKGNIKIGKHHYFKRKNCWSSINKINKLKGKNKYPNCHPWYVNDSKKTFSITGHHILSVSGILLVRNTVRNGNFLENAKYDSNHCRNIVALPTLSKLACELKVPMHYGTHCEKNVLGMENNTPYHSLTTQMISHMLRLLSNSGICPGNSESERKDILLNMDYLSIIMLKWISNFQVLLHRFGKDYHSNGAGCRGIEDNIEKSKNEINFCQNRYHEYDLTVDTLKRNDRLKTLFELEKSECVYEDKHFK